MSVTSSRTARVRRASGRVRLLVAAMPLLAGLAWPVSAGVDSWRHRRAVEAAKAALASRSVAAAHAQLRLAAERWPDDSEVAFLLGACEQRQGRFEAADAAYRKVRDDSPFAPPAALFRARMALQSDRFAAAEGPLLTALRGTGAPAVEARETLVNLYKIQGRFDEARSLVLGASGAYHDLAGLLRESERLSSNFPKGIEECRQALEKAAKRAPDDDRVWLGWANLCVRVGRLDDARSRLEACLKRRPDDAAVWRAWLSWALAKEDVGEVEAAIRHLPPDRLAPAEVLNLGAWLAARSGDVDSERRSHERLVAREPGSLGSLARLADIADADGRKDEAAELRSRRGELNRIKYEYQALIDSLNPGNARDAARLAERLGRYLESRTLWTLVTQTTPGDSEALAAEARLLSLEASRPPGPTLRDLIAERNAAPRQASALPTDATATRPRFTDDALAAGLAFTFDNGVTPQRQMPETMSGGIGLLDYDGDGWLDVYAVQGGTFPPDTSGTTAREAGDRLFHNRGDGTFEDLTESAGLASIARGYGHGVAVGDFDGDGRPDLFVTRYRHYALYRNRGDGSFEDATAAAGLDGDRDWPTSAAFADLDGDGDLDLYVCHYVVWDETNPVPCKNGDAPAYCSPQHLASRADHLFRHDNGRFVDVTAEAGIVDHDGRGLGVVASDLDGDGRIDLFVANDQSANFLFMNRGGMRFEETAHTAGVASNGEGAYQAGMGVALGDFDGDGRPDLAKTNFYNESSTLYRNLGEGAFSDATSQVGMAAPTRHLLGFGVAWLDADNDGWPDLATANGHVDDPGPGVPRAMPAQLLLNRGGRSVVDVSERAGAPWRVLRIARGLAAGDLDNDGRQDILLVSHGAPLAYFHNQTTGGRWLTLGLKGGGRNGDAIGARVTVTAAGRKRVAWRMGGGSYQSASDPRLSFGLGDAQRVEAVEVAWPSGRVEQFGTLAADAGYVLREGEGEARPLPGFTPRVSERPNSRQP